MFAPEIGRMAGVNVPLIPFAHEYLITRPSGLPLDMPTMRDPSLLVYYRPESGGLVMGGYERTPAPWGLDGIPADFNGRLLEPDWDRFEPLMTNAIVRTPSLKDAEVVRLVNGPEAFTPDNEFILGPTDVRGFWVAAGFCAHGLAGAGGMGRLVAEWASGGRRGLDAWERDSRRFGRAYASRDYTLARTYEVYSTYYDVKYPGHERTAGRPLRVSPVYSRLTELGAAFGEKSGWERVNWFEPNGTHGDQALRPHGWAGRLWSPAIGVEHNACRESAAMFDFTSFAKIEVRGGGAADFLESLADNRVARAVGTLTYTQMLNEAGGIECDFTITRLGERRFRVITGTAFGMHDLSWIRDHAPADGSVEVEDVTSAYACVGLWGPEARSIVQRLTPADIGNQAFPFMTAREIAVGSIPCLALRVTYVGELGWELYCPSEFGLRLWDTVWEAGPDRRQDRGPRDQRRLRLHRRPVDRVRVHPGGLHGRHSRRGRHLRHLDRRPRRERTPLRPDRLSSQKLTELSDSAPLYPTGVLQCVGLRIAGSNGAEVTLERRVGGCRLQAGEVLCRVFDEAEFQLRDSALQHAPHPLPEIGHEPHQPQSREVPFTDLIEIGMQQLAIVVDSELVVDREVRQVEEPIPHARVLPVDDANLAVIEEVRVQEVVVARHIWFHAPRGADPLRDRACPAEFARHLNPVRFGSCAIGIDYRPRIETSWYRGSVVERSDSECNSRQH